MYCNKVFNEKAINDLIIHLIISKMLRKQKCREKRKTMRKNEVEAKKELSVMKSFHSFKYKLDYANVRLFFLISS